jgi:ribosomal protein L28
MDCALTKEEKKLLLERQLKGYHASIYDLTISARVLKSIDDKEKLTQVTKDLERLEKGKDELLKIIDEIDKE